MLTQGYQQSLGKGLEKYYSTGGSKEVMVRMRTEVMLALLIIGIILLSGCVGKTGITKEQLLEKYSKISTQFDIEKSKGNNVTEVEIIIRQAKEAYDKGDYKEADSLLDKASAILEKKDIPTKSLISLKPPTNLTRVDRSWLYEGLIYETHPYYYPDHSFKEITEQVPSLFDLGIRTIYLMPVWEQPPGERDYSLLYHTYDYYKINPVYGTPQELKELINTAHKYNMKVLFDLVTCCTWKGSAIWNKGGVLSISLSELQNKAKNLGWTLEYKTVDGNRYASYNCSTRNNRILCDFGGMIVEDKVILLQYPQVGWGFAIDKTNPETIEYFTEVAKYYVKEYDIDGWRVDAPSNNWNPSIISGDRSSQQLLRRVKTEITNIKPDAILLSEWPTIATIYPSDPPVKAELDEESEASYSYFFYHKISETIRAKKLFDVLGKENIWYNRTRVRFSESHDTYQRINNVAPQINKPLIVLLSTIPGIPMIQAGQEIGATYEFFTVPTVDWANGDYELRNFYKKVFEIRNNHVALKYGSLETAWKSGDNVYAYSRSYEDEKVVVIINFLDKSAKSKIDLSFMDKGSILYDALNDEKFTVDDPNNFEISVPAYGSRIFVPNKT